MANIKIRLPPKPKPDSMLSSVRAANERLQLSNELAEHVRLGHFDLYLNLLGSAIGERLALLANPVNKLAVNPELLKPGHVLGLHGATYNPVRVQYLGRDSESDDMALCKVLVGNYKMEPGAKVAVPYGMLSVVGTSLPAHPDHPDTTAAMDALRAAEQKLRLPQPQSLRICAKCGIPLPTAKSRGARRAYCDNCFTRKDEDKS